MVGPRRSRSIRTARRKSSGGYASPSQTRTKTSPTKKTPKSLESSISRRLGYRKANKKELYGTSGLNSVETSYSNLVKTFGKPQYRNKDSDAKNRVTWVLKDKNGNILTIYDWKEYGTPLSQIKEWQIGGKGKTSKASAKQLRTFIEVVVN